MTLQIPRHAQLFAGDQDAPPPPLSITTARFTSLDFSVTDLGTGGAVALTVHRVPGLLPERLSRLQYRLDTGPGVDLPQPVGPGVTVIEGLGVDAVRSICLRAVDFDPETGQERFGEWSPPAEVTPTAFAAANLLSDTVDPVANGAGRWIGGIAWTGGVDAEGFAAFASAEARQDVDPRVRPPASAVVLATATLRSDGAAATRVSLRAVPASGPVVAAAAEIDWSTGVVSLAEGGAIPGARAIRIDYDPMVQTARVALEVPLADGAASALEFAVEGEDSAFAGADLRLWSAGDSAWPDAEPVAGPTRVPRLVPPVATGFGTAALEAEDGARETLPFTVFGDEQADSTLMPPRSQGLSGASADAGGSGYTDGSYTLAASGGEGGTVTLTVSGGAVTAAVVASQGRRYLQEPALDLSALLGGSGAAVSVSRGFVQRDYWPALGEAGSGVSWGGVALGAEDFAVEGFVAEGAFRAAGIEHTLDSGAVVRVDADGRWQARANGATEGLGEDEGFATTLGLVLTNGGTRAVADLTIGFAGEGPRPLRIIGTPMLLGSGRWGDRLVALPGRVSGDGVEDASVRYDWLVDGTPVEGATGPTLRLTPAIAPLGASVAVRVTWALPAREEYWLTPAVTVQTWKVTADGEALSVGALTPPALGGLPVGAAGLTITSGNGAGHWTLTERDGVAFLRPAAGPTTPGSDPTTAGETVLAGGYALGLSDGRSLSVTVQDGAYSLGRLADLAALAQDLAAPAGQGVYGFDLTGGGRIVLWNGGDWGHVEDAGDPESALRDLHLVGSDADGGAGQIVVESYDPAEPTALTGPVHLAKARNVAWRVDLRHAPPVTSQGSVFDGGAILAVTTLGRTLAVEDCTVQGPHLMLERLTGVAEPSGVLIGGGTGQLAGAGLAAIRLSRLSLADIERVVDGGFGALTIEDCRVARCGSAPVALGPETGDVAIRRTVMQDALSAGRFNSGAWVSVAPDSAAGYGPVYRPGTGVTIEDCVFLPGQGGVPAMVGVVLARDGALGDGSAEADFGYVYSPVTLRRSLIMGGIAGDERDGLWLSSGEAGVVEDCAVLADVRARGVALGLTHGNGFRPLGAGFAVTRSVMNADALGAGVTRSDQALVEPEAYAGVFAGGPAAAFAPRTLVAALGAFTPDAGGALDIGAGPADTIGPIRADGHFKGDLSAVPAILPVAFGTVSWGGAALVTGIGWGAIPEQAGEPFTIRLNRSSVIAPGGVHVELTGLTEDELLSDHIVWDFGEDYDFDALPVEAQVERSARFGRGHIGAHVYRAPGIWEISVSIENRRGDRRTAHTTVEVRDPDAAYPGTLTLAYAPDGDFTGAPAGATLTTDANDVIDALEANNAPRRVMMKAGTETGLDSTIFMTGDKLLTRFGEGPAPKFRVGPMNTGVPLFRLNFARRSTIAGIALETDYDVTNPAPPEEHPEVSVRVSGLDVFDTNFTQDGTLVDLSVKGAAISVHLTPRMIVANCSIRDWYDYGVFGVLERGGIVGCRIAQNPNAFRNTNLKSRNDGVTRNSADHGPIRLGQMVASTVTQCSLESWNGWSPGVGGPADQPSLRINSNLTADTDHGGVIQGNYILGGIAVLTNVPIGSAVQRRGSGLVVADNILEGRGRTETFIASVVTPITFRNNVLYMPENEADPSINDRVRTLIAGSMRGEITAENQAGLFRFHYNSVIVETSRDSIFSDVEQEGPAYARFEDQDNVFYAPNLPVPVADPDPTPLRGFAPDAGSALLAAGGAPVPLTDRRGARRGVPAARGALEPFRPRTLDFASGPGAAALGAGGALAQTGSFTFAARLARTGSGTRAAFRAGSGHALELFSPSDQLRLALAYDDASVLVDRTFSGLALAGEYVSVLLAVDLAGGLAGGRTVSLWVDGVELEASTAAARPLLLDPAGLVLMDGTAGARVEEWLWADTTAALDPATWWGAFFDTDGTVFNLEPAGRVGPVVPEVFVAGSTADLDFGRNRGTGPRLVKTGDPVAVL